MKNVMLIDQDPKDYLISATFIGRDNSPQAITIYKKFCGENVYHNKFHSFAVSVTFRVCCEWSSRSWKEPQALERVCIFAKYNIYL